MLQAIVDKNAQTQRAAEDAAVAAEAEGMRRKRLTAGGWRHLVGGDGLPECPTGQLG